MYVALDGRTAVPVPGKCSTIASAGMAEAMAGEVEQPDNAIDLMSLW